MAAQKDSTYLLVVRHPRTRFGVEQVAVPVNDPQNHDAYESLDVLCGSTAFGSANADPLAGVEAADDLPPDDDRSTGSAAD